MDPLTQGVLGTVAAQPLAKTKTLCCASVLGFLSGMAPDLDVLIRSSSDPLLALEYHRHFTHSLIFIPFGGLLCALCFFYVFSRRAGLSFLQTYMFCTLGYATHGLLDACTTYGTQLLWPFSDVRVAWNTISIIDPLLTIPLLIMVIVAMIFRSRRWSVMALSWLVIYTLLGIVQRERAEAFGWQLAQQRGHQAINVEAKPSFANILVWKVVYSTREKYYVDGVRVALGLTHYSGASIDKLNVDRDFPWLNKMSQQAKDIERFRWFSNGYVAVSPTHPNRIIDIRYSLIPNEIRGLWGIELDSQASDEAHIDYIADRSRDANTFNRLWQMIIGDPIAVNRARVSAESL